MGGSAGPIIRILREQRSKDEEGVTLMVCHEDSGSAEVSRNINSVFFNYLNGSMYINVFILIIYSR